MTTWFDALARFRGGGASNPAMSDENMAALMGVMGTDYIPDQRGADGLTAGGAGTPGGLMAGNLQDPRTWITAATGVMGIPGMQRLGGQLLQNMMTQQLGLPMQMQQHQAEMQAKALDMQRKELELQKLQSDVENRVDGRTLEEYSGRLENWQKNYLTNTQPLYRALSNVYGLLDRIGTEGNFADLDNPDQIAMISAYIKMLRPDEAINEGDIASVRRIEGLPGWIYSYAESLGAGNKLPVGAVAQLTRALLDQTQIRARDLAIERQRAINLGELQRLRGFEQLLSPELQQRDLQPYYRAAQEQRYVGLNGDEQRVPGRPPEQGDQPPPPEAFQ